MPSENRVVQIKECPDNRNNLLPFKGLKIRHFIAIVHMYITKKKSKCFGICI